MLATDDDPRLVGVRADAARRLAERAADPTVPLAELRELDERLRLIDAALGARPPPTRRWPPALWTMLVIGILVSVAATVEVRSVPFALELQAHATTLQLPAAGELESQPVDAQLRIEGQTRLQSPFSMIEKESSESGANQIVLRGPQLTLRRVRYPADSTLVVRSGPQVQLSLDSAHPELIAEVEFAGSTTWRMGDAPESQPRVFDHAEWVRASAGDLGQPVRRPPPLDIWLDRGSAKTYVWNSLRPVAMQFVERRAGAAWGGQAIVGSSIEEASLTLPVTGNDVKLRGGDHLEIAGLEIEHFELKAGDLVAIKLSGTARVLTARSGAFERSLKPSLLEFVARHHTVGLLWSAALFLWGALAWVRQQLSSIAA